jgi:hypothetical protein
MFFHLLKNFWLPTYTAYSLSYRHPDEKVSISHVGNKSKSGVQR